MKYFFILFLLCYGLLSCQTRTKHIQQSEYYHKIAIGLINDCNHPRALSHLLKAVRLNPKDFLIRHTLGVIYYTMSEYDKAAMEFKQALRINPQLTEARVNLARIYIDQGKLKQALREIQKAEKDLTYSDYLKVVGLKGLAYYKQANYKEAKNWLTEAFSLPNGQNCFVYLNLGRAEMALKNLNRAEELFKKSLQICRREKPQCKEAAYEEYFSLAELYFKKRNKKRAKYYLKLFLKKRKKGPDVERARKLLKQLS